MAAWLTEPVSANATKASISRRFINGEHNQVMIMQQALNRGDVATMVTREFSASRRSKAVEKDWIASSLTFLAMTVGS
jgi:hypothetical protein